MNRKLLTLTLSLLLGLAAVTAIMAGMSNSHPALAHPVNTDGALTEWTMAQPITVNLAHIGRNSAQEGEYIWRDMPGDERTDFGSPDTRVDLLQFRITADETNLYFLAVMNNIDQATGNGAPMVQIAVDTTRDGSGNLFFGGNATTTVSAQAAWEYLITTRFGSGNSDLRVWDTSWNASYVGTAVISDGAETIEGAIPWSALGFSAPPTLPLRFTVATFRANGSDDVWWPGGNGNAVLDAVTNYGSPAPATRLQNTWAEVSDGDVDYYFDVWFEPDGDTYPPLVVSEYQPNPPGTDTAREWIEVFNASPVALPLDLIKVGDEETPGQNEGMFRFPPGYSIAPGATKVVALQADTGSDGFYYLFGFCPDFEVTNTTGSNCSVPDMSSYSAWATGSLAIANSDDEILILDGSDTILDVAGHTDGGYTPYSGVVYLGWNSGWEQSIERRPVYRDTNDCSVDFRNQSTPTPAQARPDLVISKSGPAMAMPGGVITYTITYSNTGVNDAHQVVITDVLPNHTSYLTDTSGFLCTACTPGATGVLTWAVGTVTPTDGLSFYLVLQVNSGAPLGSLLTNTVAIATPDPEVTTTNNSAQFGMGISPLDLAVVKTGPMYGIVGRELAYTITLENRGVTTATNVILTDTLPLSTTYVSDNSGVSPTCNAGVCVWSFGDVPSNTLFTFNLTVTVDANVVGGTILTNTVEATTEAIGDNPANNTAWWSTTVYPMVSIHDIQYVPDPATDDKSPYVNQVVWVEGVVIADSGVFLSSGGAQIRYFIEDPAGGPWSGLYIYKGSGKPNVSEGDYVRLLGKVVEYVVGGSNQTELDISASWALQEVLSASNPLPAPEVITTGMLAGAATAEQWEGVLIEFRNATVTNPNLGYNEWAFDDGTGAARGDAWAKTGGNTRLTYVPALGDYYKFIRGIGWQSYGTYKVEPRYDADIDLDYPTTFVYHDLEDVVRSGEAVYLAGSFNGWSTTATPMSPNADFSVFSVTVVLENPGTYEYKYVVYTDTVPSGPANWNWLQSQNRSVTVSAPTTVDDYRHIQPGYVVLQWPHATTTTVGVATENIYGQIWADDLTSREGPPRAILAEVGYGTDPNPANWTTWSPMTWNTQSGNNDEFMGVLTPNVAGVYSYVVRFNGNWGAGNPHNQWVYGDTDGVYSGEPFEIENAGVLTVLAPGLSVSKSVAPDADVPLGGVVTYTVVLSNSGAGDALGVVLTDALPAEVAFGGWVQQSGAVYESGVITWTGTVTGNAQVTLVFTATLGTDPGLYNRTVANTASFVSANAGSGSATATFATERRYWVYLPLVMRNR
ncbi:MAG: DUF11 domain-containing protein [Thermoflexales bacterium]|nr:DUF11 domain-containing protein [Thermoflexales bacterium]